MSTEATSRERAAEACETQARFCQPLGSPLYARLLEHAAEDIRREGALARLIDGWSGDPMKGFLPLRILGAVHHLVLTGQAPELAKYYPSVGGRPLWPDIWPAFLNLVEDQPDALRRRLHPPPQTNEVQRSAGLLGGFLYISRETGLPLQLREIGSSAGLNLNWDRYRYELGPHRWGDPRSPVRIVVDWEGPPAAFDTPVTVDDRCGCDSAPVQIDDPNSDQILESYVWPDHARRLEVLRAAIAAALPHPPTVVQAQASGWLATELEIPHPGRTRVVFHSAVWAYMEEAEQRAVRDLIERAGQTATEDAPFAWLHLEFGVLPEVRVQLWPSGDEVRLGRVHPHGLNVRWFDVSDRGALGADQL